MNANQKREAALRRLESQKKEISAQNFECDPQNHKWGEPYAKKLTVRDIVSYRPREESEMDRHLDSWAEHANSQPVPIFDNITKDGWERVCSICGKVEQTVKTQAITKVIGEEPKFS